MVKTLKDEWFITLRRHRKNIQRIIAGLSTHKFLKSDLQNICYQSKSKKSILSKKKKMIYNTHDRSKRSFIYYALI